MLKLPASLAPYSKAVGALLGGLTPTVVVGILAAVGVHVDPTLAGLACAVLAPFVAYFFPANKPKPTGIAAVLPAPSNPTA